ncbi:MAG TPA: STAS domain-containing protein, partial [Candidatus Baltobacteraceae bacterium]|nr:STAS domain-containing protein [Candidatus Baltobacteraceae bacterium]
TEYIRAMPSGEYGDSFVGQRVKTALLYSKVGIYPSLYLGASHHLMRAIGTIVEESGGKGGFASFMSLEKVFFFEVGIVVDVLIQERETTIIGQQKELLELSTPVLQVRDHLLILPVIGAIDGQRAKQLTDTLLRSIRANRAKIVVIDITGVGAVDSKVANHLILTVSAARLMGTKVIVTGLSADVAQSLVTLGVDLSALNTVGDLQGGLEEAERFLDAQNVPAV